MEHDDIQLLRKFAEQHDEDAFVSLVRRHGGMVLAAAQRQLAGDHHAAEDITQQVFVQLARKARQLLAHRCLEGWLHTATRLACLDRRRREARRTEREREAVMNQLEPEESPGWDELAPVLDEVLAELDSRDRELILMRYINHRSSQEDAARLGVSAAAARKQLERAMDRLREGLARRGIVAGLAGLAVALETHGRAEISTALAQEIARQAVSVGAAAGGGWLVRWPRLIAGTVAVGVLCWFASGPLGWRGEVTRKADAPPERAAGASKPQVFSSGGNPTAGLDLLKPREFTLRVRDKETSELLNGANVLFAVSPDGNTEVFGVLRTTTNGIATTDWTNGIQRFIADVYLEGYAMTRVEWRREAEQLPVPDTWTLDLERAPMLGGVVVDPDGQPVAGATVTAQASGDFYYVVPDTRQPQVSHPQRRMFGGRPVFLDSVRWGSRPVQAVTDGNGRWALRLIARQVQEFRPAFWLQVEHPTFQSGRIQPDIEATLDALRAGEAVTVLTPRAPALATGLVRDAAGQPLTNAQVTDGVIFTRPGAHREGDHHTQVNPRGEFALAVRPPASDEVTITASAPGYAPVSALWKGEPLDMVLGLGRPLRLRVLSMAGGPLPDIRVENGSFQNTGGPETNRSTHVGLQGVTDASGRVSWDHAPIEPLLFCFYDDSGEFQSLAGEVLLPDQSEQTIQLLPALRISGTVRDAQTGREVAQFRVASTDAFESGHDPDCPGFALRGGVVGELFERGWFELKHNPSGCPISPGLRGPREAERLGTYLKITAEGYAGLTTRFIDSREGQVHLSVQLKPALPSRVRVMNAAGQPVAGASVKVFRADQEAVPSGLSGEYELETRTDGSFDLPAEEGLGIVWVQDKERSATASKTAPEVRRTGEIRLQPAVREDIPPAPATR